MSTQLIKNIINTQVDSVITRAKQEVKNEGKKKITELQKQIPTPEDIINKLKTTTSPEACSEKGIKKQNKIYNVFE